MLCASLSARKLTRGNEICSSDGLRGYFPASRPHTSRIYPPCSHPVKVSSSSPEPNARTHAYPLAYALLPISRGNSETLRHFVLHCLTCVLTIRAPRINLIFYFGNERSVSRMMKNYWKVLAPDWPLSLSPGVLYELPRCRFFLCPTVSRSCMFLVSLTEILHPPPTRGTLICKLTICSKWFSVRFHRRFLVSADI